jgi:predicted secreted protein
MVDSSHGEGVGRRAQVSMVANALLVVWLVLFLSPPFSPRSHDTSTDEPAARTVSASSDPLARWTTRRSIRPTPAGVTVPAVP